MSSRGNPNHSRIVSPTAHQRQVQRLTTASTQGQSAEAVNSNVFVFPHRPNRPVHLPQVKGPLPPDIIVDPQGLFFCFVCRTHVPGGTSNLNQHLKGKRHAFSNRQFPSAAQKEAVRVGYLEAAARARQRDRQRDKSNGEDNLRTDERERNISIPRHHEGSVTGSSSFQPPVMTFRGGPSQQTQSVTDANATKAISRSSIVGPEMEVRMNPQQVRPHPSRRINPRLQDSTRRDQRLPLPPPCTSPVSRSEVMASRQVSVGRRSPIQKMDQANPEYEKELPARCDGNCVRMRHLSDFLMVEKAGNSGMLLTRQQVYEGHGSHTISGRASSGTILGVQGSPSRISKVRTDGSSQIRRNLHQNVPRCRIFHRLVPPHLIAMARDGFPLRHTGLNVATMSDNEHEQMSENAHRAGFRN